MSIAAKRSIILVDAEGTLLNNTQREQFLPPKHLTGPAATLAWQQYYKLLRYDTPNREVMLLCNQYAGRGARIIIVTGVMQQFRQELHNWLTRMQFRYSKLRMRRDDDYRANVEIKAGWAAKLAQHYQIIAGLDDDPAVLAMLADNFAVPALYLVRQGNLLNYYNVRRGQAARVGDN